MFLRVLGVPLALVGTAQPAAGQRHARLIGRIDSLAGETLRRSPPGLSLAVARGKSVIVARGYGFARLADSARATERTIYPIASITKQFTAAAVLKLAEQKRLRLSDPLGRYLPGFPDSGDPVQIKHLLNHTSGLPQFPLVDGTSPATEAVGPGRVVEYLRTERPPFRPGERFVYSNSGYFLLGTVIEQVTGVPYPDYLRDALLTPNGLRSTGECHLDTDSSATGYTLKDSLFVPVESALPVPGFAAGGLCSTVLDLTAWVRALGDRKAVNNFSWHLMTEPAELKDGSRASYGYGLTLGRLDKHRFVGHGGATPGFTTQITFFPDDDVTVVVLANSDEALTRRLADQVARLVLGLPEPEVKDVLLDPARVDRYKGSYILQGDSMPINVRFQHGRLEAQLGEGEAFRLLYQGNDEFVSESDPATKIFFRTRNGPARSLEFHSDGLVLLANRAAEAPK